MDSPRETRALPTDPHAGDAPDRAETEVDLEGAKFDFPCRNCGAGMTWDPEADALTCAYCESVVQVPRAGGTIIERDLDAAGDVARGFGLELKVAKCSNCGARVTFDEASTSEACVYCGSANVLAQEASRNAIRPESLVPLTVAESEVRASFQSWLRGLWFRPNDLKKTKRFDAVGVYVPFWTFDCEVHSEWSADAGYYYYVTQTYTTMVNGKPQVRTRRVRKIRWVPAWGERDDAYDDDLVIASKGLPPNLVAKLGSFETGGLVPYRPEYLAGWRAEEYQVDLQAGWERGQANVVRYQESKCAGDVPGDTHRNLRVQNHIRNVRWKHVLLPIWSLQYRYRSKPYTVLVHGQTGRVVGDAPLSWVKIALVVLFVVLLIGGVVVASNA